MAVDKNFIPKRLKPFVPPPDEPKHPSLLYRAVRLVRRLYKKLFVRPAQPVFPAEIVLTHWLTPEEIEPFKAAFAQDAKQLSFLLNRDMVEFWELNNQPETL